MRNRQVKTTAVRVILYGAFGLFTGFCIGVEAGYVTVLMAGLFLLSAMNVDADDPLI